MKNPAQIKSFLIRFAVCVFGLASLVIVVSTRVRPLGKFFTEFAKAEYGGNLYNMSRLNYFRARTKWDTPRNDTALGDAGIIVFGDSFTNLSPGEGSFHMRLEDVVNVPVFWQYHYCENHQSHYPTPLHFLKEKAPPDLRTKLLIWVVWEVGLKKGHLDYNALLQPHPGGNTTNAIGKAQENKSGLDINELLFDNSKIEYVLRNSFFTRWAFEVVASGRFFVLGETSELVPKYSLSPKLLFYHASVEAFYEPVKPEQMEETVLLFGELRKELIREYGVTLILVPVPSKYTIYHDFADPGSSYDGFLTNFSGELEKKGVINVNLYPIFMQHRSEILYWPDDTHWNGEGISVATAATTQTIRENNLLRNALPEHGS